MAIEYGGSEYVCPHCDTRGGRPHDLCCAAKVKGTVYSDDPSEDVMDAKRLMAEASKLLTDAMERQGEAAVVKLRDMPLGEHDAMVTLTVRVRKVTNEAHARQKAVLLAMTRYSEPYAIERVEMANKPVRKRAARCVSKVV